jgi:hypothetical protein
MIKGIPRNNQGVSRELALSIAITTTSCIGNKDEPPAEAPGAR